MARKVTWGSPHPTSHYLFPRSAWAYVLPSAVVGSAVLGFLLLSHGLGLRSSLSPGVVTGPHAPFESRCEECHQQLQGVANRRCQRCHDPAGASRLGNAAHVLFGSGDPAKAAAAPEMSCARCHVDHKGRSHRLSRVDQEQCEGCHFRGLAAHPELAVLRAPAHEVPGLLFGHERHVQEVQKEAGGAPSAACTRCHEPNPATRDFDPISFDRHCASCHAKGGSVGSLDPIPAEHALPPGPGGRPGEEFEASRGKISRPSLRHRDEWLLASMRQLRREVRPETVAAERGTLRARLAQLERRLVLATPLASLDAEALKVREAAFLSELGGIEARMRGEGQAQSALDGLGRLEDVSAAAKQSGDPAHAAQALDIASRAASLKPDAGGAPPLPKDESALRQQELLGALDAIEAADEELLPRVADLRRRLLALAAGSSGREALARARAQRQTDIERVRDEIRLREMGVRPPSAALTLSEQRVLKKAIDETQARIRELGEDRSGPSLDAEEREGRRESLALLTTPCVKCHLVQDGALARVRAARPVLFRSVFVHQPHLVQSDCSRCHPNVAKSRASQDLNVPGIQGCRDCHRPSGVTTECLSCHRYHPRLAS